MERGHVNATNGGLQQSRAKLRRELLPKEVPDVFPRSKVMRAVFDPRTQKVLMLALSAAAMLLSRRGPQSRSGQLVARVSDLTRTLSRGGWR